MAEDLEVSQGFIDRVNRELAHRELTAQAFADAIGVSDATISRLRRRRKASTSTIEKICSKFYINKDGSDTVKINITGYREKSTYESYIGKYLWIRPIFDSKDAIGSYPVEIEWDDISRRLLVRRLTSDLRLNDGEIYINRSGYINFFSASEGYASLTTLCSVTEDGYMFGAMLALGEFAGKMFTPTCCPVVLIQKEDLAGESERIVTPNSAEYAHFRGLLNKTMSQKFAVFKTFGADSDY